MKIYKVNLDPSNPVEKLVKVPVGEDYGLQINWDYEKYKFFPSIPEDGYPIETALGWLTSPTYPKIVPSCADSLCNKKGQFNFLTNSGTTSLPKVESVGDEIIWYYGPKHADCGDYNETNNLGSIKVVGVESDAFDVDLLGLGISSIKEEGVSTTIKNDCISIYSKNAYIGSDCTMSIKGCEKVYINGCSIAITSNCTSIIGIESINIKSDCMNIEGCESLYIGSKSINIRSDHIGLNGTIYICGNSICMTKFLADYGG